MGQEAHLGMLALLVPFLAIPQGLSLVPAITQKLF